MCCGPGSLAAAARQGAGLWQRRDLLAAAARLAAGRRVGGPAPSAAGLAGRRRPGRLVSGGHRQRERAGPTWGNSLAQTRSTGASLASKYHLVIDATGLPLAVGLSAANTHDSQLLEPMVDAVPAVIGPRGRPGRPRRRPAKLHGDKGYDYPTCRRLLRRRGITPRIARRGSRRRPGWAATAGRWNAPWPGCWRIGASRSAMSAAPTSSRRSSIWPAPWSRARRLQPL